MKKYIIIAMLASSCSGNSNPASPGAVTGDKSLVKPLTSLSWPVEIPGDGFGKEDPNYPPASYQCPVGYVNFYNNHNWLCKNGADIEMPKVNGYPR